MSAAHPSPKESVLVDLGCGTGTFVQKFGKHFRKIFAADFATAVVRKAERTYKGPTPASWQVADVKDCPKLFGDRIADLAVCLNVITSPSAARRKSLWASVKAVTKPSGHMLVVVPSSESCEMVNAWENRARKKPKPAFRKGSIAERGDIWQKHFSRSELVATITDLGWITRSRLLGGAARRGVVSVVERRLAQAAFGNEGAMGLDLPRQARGLNRSQLRSASARRVSQPRASGRIPF